MPNLLTGYPQVVKFSGDDVLCSRSVDSFLSRGELQKDGSILIGKTVFGPGLLSMSNRMKSKSIVYIEAIAQGSLADSIQFERWLTASC
ncbi:hypothetical protein COMA1_10200 [Candidatus Nitrospira nitrosa]|uniref:Uncharacterized protein n=1 Tax=Candidatus Nitrospira nitrosa TaxID=1742972 RepID=A0A0S4L705_9BACT|nr:hypothetical protein COMA1_10200 [Candidatus Nitrospira nitrosa]